MRTVLRLEVDSRVSLLDPGGAEHQGVIERYERDRAVIRVESSSPSPLDLKSSSPPRSSKAREWISSLKRRPSWARRSYGH